MSEGVVLRQVYQALEAVVQNVAAVAIVQQPYRHLRTLDRGVKHTDTNWRGSAVIEARDMSRSVSSEKLGEW